MTPRQLVAVLWWYLREVSGDAAYDRYLERAAGKPDQPPLSRRAFERDRLDQRDHRPGSRCC